MSDVHPTALIEPGAELGATAKIGPFCHVGRHVRLGEHVELISHVVVAGHTTIGDGTRIFPFASIGHQPQDLKFKGEESRLVIGRNNVIREQVTMNPGTEGGGMLTKIGDSCLFMVGVHVAHDCIIGNEVIMANNATLAGHVKVGDFSVFGGLSAVHQFVRVGPYAMIGGVTGVERDVIPYGSVMGDRARLSGLNIVGMQRRGFTREEINGLRNAYQALFESDKGTFAERVVEVTTRFAGVRPVEDVLRFIKDDSSRGLVQPKSNGNGG
ncbi:MAG TPA: acyl-ACP--UDP-N-acetylglucosamine O-acyltransferase [Stellaceae bacterium]|jgi:UDP-N-acetylglucosamine acyltransferase|nr:acyl-ACP--UDP-N-acetylglucosamine O-acyltransferase [Stellaceae bacterium]